MAEAPGPNGPGDGQSSELVEVAYDELRRMAEQMLRQERAGHTLQATALVHEAFMKLAAQTRALWNDELHFRAVASIAMRRILVNHERDRRALKRGGGAARLVLDTQIAAVNEPEVDLIELDDALNQLARVDAQQARVVELRFFAGLTDVEIGQVIGVSDRTVRREWTMTRAWLRSQLIGDVDSA